MKHFQLEGQVREVGNKAVIKAFRRQGLVPCNLYGKGIDNILFTVKEKDLKGLLFTPASFIVDLKLSDGKAYTCILHELQFHPVDDNCLHIDFLAVSEDKPIAIDVPVTITGHAAGVQAGGKFSLVTRKIRVSATMENLPDTITVDITKLQLDKAISAGELHFDNITILSPKTTVICRVKSTRQMMAAAKTEGEAEAEA